MKWLLLGIVGILITLFLLPVSRSVIFETASPLLAAVSEKIPDDLGIPGLSGRKLPKGAISPKKIPGASGRERTWTFKDGSQVKGVLVSANSEKVQFRLSKHMAVGQVGLDSLAPEDRQRVKSWIESEGRNGVVGYPIPLKSHSWPQHWQSSGEIELTPLDEANRWRSQNFDITNQAGTNRESLEAITLICEAVDGALSSLPLPVPLNWGRGPDQLRKIIIEDAETYRGIPNSAGYWDPNTGKVHICADALIERDRQLVVFEFDKPEKLQKYDIIVHEVTHQSMGALIYLGIPSWVTEGIAEYMSATQFAPGAYHFGNTNVSIRHHVNKHLLGDRIVRDRKMNLVHLRTLMNRDQYMWNRTVESGEPAGMLQYDVALMTVDYFMHRDHPNGLHFRRYLECILSGVPEHVARDRHLMRGRGYPEIEDEIRRLWQPYGLTVNFQERGELKRDDVTIDWNAEDVKRSIASRRAFGASAEN